MVDDEYDDGPPPKPGMPPAQIAAIIGGIVVALAFMAFFFLPRGNGGNDTPSEPPPSVFSGGGGGNNNHDLPEPPKNTRPQPGEFTDFAGENLPRLEAFANEIRDVAGQIVRRYDDQFAEDPNGTGLDQPMIRCKNQLSRHIKDNRLESLLAKDRADIHFTDITIPALDAYGMIDDLVTLTAGYSNDHNHSAEAQAAVAEMQKKIIDLCLQAIKGVDAERERLKSQSGN
ncbi:MAG: hypothetical protein AB7S36_09240 [Planctomycetota bacterium]